MPKIFLDIIVIDLEDLELRGAISSQHTFVPICNIGNFLEDENIMVILGVRKAIPVVKDCLMNFWMYSIWKNTMYVFKIFKIQKLEKPARINLKVIFTSIMYLLSTVYSNSVIIGNTLCCISYY